MSTMSWCDEHDSAWGACHDRPHSPFGCPHGSDWGYCPAIGQPILRIVNQNRPAGLLEQVKALAGVEMARDAERVGHCIWPTIYLKTLELIEGSDDDAD